jgi:hypothetical protein
MKLYIRNNQISLNPDGATGEICLSQWVHHKVDRTGKCIDCNQRIWAGYKTRQVESVTGNVPDELLRGVSLRSRYRDGYCQCPRWR